MLQKTESWASFVRQTKLSYALLGGIYLQGLARLGRKQLLEADAFRPTVDIAILMQKLYLHRTLAPKSCFSYVAYLRICLIRKTQPSYSFNEIAEADKYGRNRSGNRQCRDSSVG